MTEEYTPGPWMMASKPSSVVGWPIVAQTGRLIASINYVQTSAIDPKVEGDDAFNRESKANGRLLEAAPCMFEAMAKAKVLIGARNDTLTEAARQSNIAEAWHILGAALAKASPAQVDERPTG